MAGKRVVYGQRVHQVKVEVARRLRSKMTPCESLLWKELRRRRHGGPHFRRQQIIDGFIVDFYSNVTGLVIEVDGESHRGEEEYDRERDGVLSERGLRVLHFRNEEILNDLERVMKDISRATSESSQPASERLPSPERGGAGGGVP